MNKLPTKREPAEPPEIGETPTWRELGERVRDVMKDFIKEGKDLERDLEPRLLPALKRLKTEIEKLIAKLEERAGEQGEARRSRARSTFPRWGRGSASRQVTSRR